MSDKAADFHKSSPLGYELREVLTDFSQKTSAHGPPKIVERKYILAKIFWVVLFLTGVGFFCYFGQKLVFTYLEYGKTTDIELKFEVLDFPAVSICNLNQFRLDKVPKEVADLAQELLKEKKIELWGGQSYYDDYFYGNEDAESYFYPWWWLPWTTTGRYHGSAAPHYYPTTPSVPYIQTTGVPPWVPYTQTTGIPPWVPPWVPYTQTTGVPPSVPYTQTTGVPPSVPYTQTTGVPPSVPYTQTTGVPPSVPYTQITGIPPSVPYTQTTGIPPTSNRKRRSIAEIDQMKLEVLEDMRDFYKLPNIGNLSSKPWFSNVGETSTDNAIILNLTRFVTANSSDEQLQAYGHEIGEMLQECRFLGKTCGPLDFYQFYDRKYGNCFTFNSGMDGHLAKVTSPGADYGLSLMLFINQTTYMPALTEQAGVRILLHRQGETPLVAEEGFNASPGTKSDIAVKYVEIERLHGMHYTNCTDQRMRPADGSLHEYYPGNYTQQGCLKTCLQKATVKHCNCANVLYRGPRNVPTCDTSQLTCAEDIVEEMLENDNCTKPCPLPCWESQYQHTISTSQWPAHNFEPYLVQTLSSRSAALKTILNEDSSDNIGAEFVKLDIYFDNLNFYKYQEKAAMSFEDLVGALGGHLGLWIGMSLISFVEVFELVILLFGACAKRLCHKDNKTFVV